MPTPGPVAVVIERPLTDCAWTGSDRISACTDGQTIWSLPNPRERLFYHEMGHVFDLRYLTDPERAAIAATLGLGTRRPWWNSEAGPEQGAQEAFADSYALCSIFGARRIQRRWSLTTGFVVSPGWRVKRVCPLILSAWQASSAAP